MAGRLVIAIVAIVLEGQQIQACMFGSELGCGFPCNCANNSMCNETTGACPDGCRDGQPRPPGNETAFDWRGPGCRIGNVAYGKPATQSGTYGNWYASKAVDGTLLQWSSTITSTKEGEYCAHTLTSGNAWWSVDLEETHNIHNITIFNRVTVGERTSHMNITVSNSSNFKDAVLCAFYPGPLADGGNVTLPCGSHLVGRYVKLERTGGVQPSVINICEVVVMGYEVIQADCSRCHSICNGLVGCPVCSGFKPPLCLTPCEEGRFGKGCEFSCFDYHCKGGYMKCGHINGGCPAGCQDWYVGSNCTTYIGVPSLSSATAISATAVSPTQVRLTWGRDDDITADIAVYYGYMTQFTIRSDFVSGVNISHVHGKAEYSAIINGLLYNTWYSLRVRVYRQHGDLVDVSPLQTREVTVKTPCKAPDRVIIVNMTASADTWPTTMYLEWQSLNSGCDNITSVQVLFRRVGSEEWITSNIMNPATSTGARIAEINEYGFLEVKVYVLNNEQLNSESLTHCIYLSATQAVTSSGPGIVTNSNEPIDGQCSTWITLAVSFAVLFGISLSVHLGVVGWISWRRLNRKSGKPAQNVSIPAKTYEGLADPVSPVPESDYDEIRMEER